MSAFDVLSIGDTASDTILTIDEDEARLVRNVKKNLCEICFDYADKIPVKDVSQSVGGNAANVATGLSRLGFDAAIYTVIGEDEPAKKIIKTFRREKISLRYLRQSGKTNQSAIISFEGERTIFTYHEKREYHLPPLPQIPWLYLSSMRNGFLAVFDDLLPYLRRHQVFVVYNPGTFQLNAGLPRSLGILHKTTVLILNRDEAGLWLGKSSDINIKDLLTQLAMLGPKNIVITAGREGSYGFDGINYYFCPIFEAPHIEATGAGDAFASGLTAALMNGNSLKEAMRWGTINSAHVVGAIGAQAGLLRLREMQSILKDDKAPLTVPIL